ncbi:Type I secretion system, membrane fusion protein LapC [Pseudomonas chlororaphis subsp. aurantiaca]|uniref:HlyD family type I secretion periplasmic adaptor subunit n=3 Tax=Pseudomonas TaxID=286 RepID=UPI0005A8B568|nr:HlyD family type I secretion periplasmic adaptor subunit [Pseudomonas chlororaphis]AZD34729.1 Type I secretion system, membrane fusion protein LapC [Pseudomonas chlororaphis subsp. aurantiaca]AZD91387.1 Type I secretion system, membrane fusion protein LapC [Pseudomonas chlororaphis subsp. aureofaciens]PWY51422.1 HlyD family type I secretion periplasmic adaptor subunit [Pseudomonas sp. RW409]TSD32855.1 HlyD family type I secretion periplasmic adaptor subunit [Pseudomonas sp. ATCC 13985]AZD41
MSLKSLKGLFGASSVVSVNKRSYAVRAEDVSFMRDLQGALIEQKTPASVLVLWLMTASVMVGLLWAHFARVEEVTQGEGRVIPASREQIIQSLEGGIMKELFVKEGQVVEQGQELLKIDPTRVGANYREALSRVQGLKGAIARLRAEAYDTPLMFPEEIKGSASIVRDETQAYNARQKTLQESVKALRRSLELAEGEVRLSAPMAHQGLVSEVEIMRLRRQANEFNLQITDRLNRFRSEANNELTRSESELAQALEVLKGREDVMNRTSITAPVRGTVNNIRVTTRGGVIQQGAEIMTLIPLEDRLLVEVKIKPADVAFIYPGLEATVKITAYDYSIYGGLSGKVEHISSDTLFDEEKARTGRENPTYYKVYVRTDRASLDAHGRSFPIIPGMIASVDIKTGEKTVLAYLLKPVLKAREAFRER